MLKTLLGNAGADHSFALHPMPFHYPVAHQMTRSLAAKKSLGRNGPWSRQCKPPLSLRGRRRFVSAKSRVRTITQSFHLPTHGSTYTPIIRKIDVLSSCSSSTRRGVLKKNSNPRDTTTSRTYSKRGTPCVETCFSRITWMLTALEDFMHS